MFNINNKLVIRNMSSLNRDFYSDKRRAILLFPDAYYLFKDSE